MGNSTRVPTWTGSSVGSKDMSFCTIRAVAATTLGVDRVEKCVVRKMGYHYFVDMHVEVDPEMSVMRAHQISHEVRDTVRHRIVAVRDVLVHIEPRGYGEDGE